VTCHRPGRRLVRERHEDPRPPGGTGHLGRVVVEHLKTDGHRVRILARDPLDDSTVEWVRADLGHSSNLASAVEGVDAVIHAATHSPAAQRPLDFIRSPTDVDIDGTCALLAAAEEAGVEHFVHVSIVGLEHMARINPYSRVKLAPSGSCASRRCRGRSSARPGFLLAARADAGEDGEEAPAPVARRRPHAAGRLG
jgi:hypothetical protein